MFKIVFFLATLGLASAKPSISAAIVSPYVAAAPLVAAPASFVTASSSQYVARNYNGLVAAAPLVAAPAFAPAARIIAPAAAAPLLAAPAPVLPAYARYAAPYIAAPYYGPSAPLVALK